MIINLNFLVITYFISLFVDWVFQWDWQAINKSKWGKNDNKVESFGALWGHSFVYAFTTASIVVLILPINVLLVYLVLFISHFIIDSRIPVKWIMKFKGMTDEQINDYKNFGFMHIGIDHRLHEMVILILAFFV